LLTLAPTYQAEATLNAPIDDLRRRYGTALGELLHIDDTHCRLRTHADTLEWLAFRLTALGCDFQLHGPPELITHLRALAARAARGTQPQHPRDRRAGSGQAQPAGSVDA
jgi:predicted DNA-binding transcriptional regulator YafY